MIAARNPPNSFVALKNTMTPLRSGMKGNVAPPRPSTVQPAPKKGREAPAIRMRVSTGVHKTSTNVSFMDTMVEDRDVSPTAAGSTRLGTSTMGTGMGLTETAGKKTVGNKGKRSCSMDVQRV
jgi:hypothetical protein